MVQYARRAELSVRIDGHDAAGIVAPYLKEFSFTDNAHGKADELQIVLHDRDGKWAGAWRPKKGMMVQASIICKSWETADKDIALPCGTFKIDEVEYTGPPDKFSIKAVSSSLTSQLRDSAKSRAWENSSLQHMAGQIAKENGLSLMYAGDPHQFKRLDQRNESDLAFVCRLAGERAMHCKVHDGKLILMDAATAEASQPGLTLPKSGNMYSPTEFSFKNAASDTAYTDAEGAYTDPASGTTHKASVQASDKQSEEKKTLVYHARAESAGEAMRLTKAQLHNANAEENTATISCMGCPRLVAGVTVNLSGFGKFSGVYFVKKAVHTLGSQEYKTQIDLTSGSQADEESAGDDI